MHISSSQQPHSTRERSSGKNNPLTNRWKTCVESHTPHLHPRRSWHLLFIDFGSNASRDGADHSCFLVLRRGITRKRKTTVAQLDIALRKPSRIWRAILLMNSPPQESKRITALRALCRHGRAKCPKGGGPKGNRNEPCLRSLDRMRDWLRHWPWETWSIA